MYNLQSDLFQACYAVLQSWVSTKFMTGWYICFRTSSININCFSFIKVTYFKFFCVACSVVLFPVAVTFFVTWWFIQFFDGFFSPIYERLGVEIFGAF